MRLFEACYFLDAFNIILPFIPFSLYSFRLFLSASYVFFHAPVCYVYCVYVESDVVPGEETPTHQGHNRSAEAPSRLFTLCRTPRPTRLRRLPLLLAILIQGSPHMRKRCKTDGYAECLLATLLFQALAKRPSCVLLFFHLLLYLQLIQAQTLSHTFTHI